MTELPTEMSDVQRAFVQAVETLGATTPADARPLAELPRISTRELLALEKSGLIREAAEGKVYLFRARPSEEAPVFAAAAEKPRRAFPMRTGIVTRIVILLLVLLIPVLLIQLAG